MIDSSFAERGLSNAEVVHPRIMLLCRRPKKQYPTAFRGNRGHVGYQKVFSPTSFLFVIVREN